MKFVCKWRTGAVFFYNFPKLLAVVQPICAKFTGIVDDSHRGNLLRPKFERNRRPGGEAVMVGNLRPPSPLSRFKLLTRPESNPSNASLVSFPIVVRFRDCNREIWSFSTFQWAKWLSASLQQCRNLKGMTVSTRTDVTPKITNKKNLNLSKRKRAGVVVNLTDFPSFFLPSWHGF